MKRFAGILVIQFVVIFAAAFLGSWVYGRWTSTHQKLPGPEMSWFQTELGVDDVQAAKLSKLDKEFEDEQAKVCEQHCARRVELAELIKTSETVTPQMETLSRELCDLEAKSQRVTLDHIFAVGKELNAAQRTKFVSKVHEQMCGSCPMRMHRDVPGKQASVSCESAGCNCCVSSDDRPSEPITPIAQSASPQPRIEFSPPKASLTLLAPQLACQPPVTSFTSSVHSSTPLFVLLSSFLI